MLGRRCKVLSSEIRQEVFPLSRSEKLPEIISEYEILRADLEKVGVVLNHIDGDPYKFFRAIVPVLERIAPYLLHDRLDDLLAKHGSTEAAIS
jgi:hypothetical protein